MIKEVLNNMFKRKKAIILEPKECKCVNLIQTNEGIVCKDCGAKK